MTGCHDCGRPYGDEHGFPDLVVPNDVWRRISPSGNDGGLLCPSCICARLAKADITCEGAFMSGPIDSVDRRLMWTMRMLENLREREDRRDRAAEAGAMTAIDEPDEADPLPADQAARIDTAHGGAVDVWLRYREDAGGDPDDGNTKMAYFRAQGIEIAAEFAGIALSRPPVHELAQKLRAEGGQP